VTGLVVDVELVAVFINKVEALLHVGETYAAVLIFLLGNTAIAAAEDQMAVVDADLDVDEGVLAIADTVFESVLDKSDEHQGRHFVVGY
jgi:hypothetical protein